MIIICSCACISPESIISSDDGHDRNREHLSFKSFISSLSQCQCTSMSQGTICPLEWAVFWMVSASVLFLRTNRVIIPSKGEDGAIKHARKGGDFLMCFVVSDAITAPIMWCLIFQSPWSLLALCLSLPYVHTYTGRSGNTERACQKAKKNKQKPKCHVQF